MGLYVPEEYGGQGLSQTGYARVFEAIGQVDGSLTVGMGVHQSIGLKGIAMFGTDEQKERFLPDLATGRKLAGFALTEPNAGSDAYNIESRAVQQSDGSWVLNGEKRWIGNGCRGDVLCAFARAEVDGKDRHIALILEKGMEGLDQSGPRYKTLGLHGNHLCPVRFNDVRVPPENVLGEPGEGFQHRDGGPQQRAHRARHRRGRPRQAAARPDDRPRHDAAAVRQAAGGLRHRRGEDRVDGLVPLRPRVDGVHDDRARSTTGSRTTRSSRRWRRSPAPSSSGTRPTARSSSSGGQAYMHGEPYERILRDIRIFPIFEGANDVLRSYVALAALKPLGEELQGLGELGLRDPISSLGTLAEYAFDRVRARGAAGLDHARARRARARWPTSVGDQVKRLRAEGEALLRKHGKGIVDQGLAHKRLADALADIVAQIAVLSPRDGDLRGAGRRGLAGRSASSPRRSARARSGASTAQLDQLERNDDDRMHSIARLAYKRGAYGYALFED